MADISQELDRIAEIIAEKSNQAVEEIVTSLMELVQDKTGEEALEILSGINLKYAMESKMAGAFVLYEQGIVSMLKNMYSTSTLSEPKLMSPVSVRVCFSRSVLIIRAFLKEFILSCFICR